MNGSPAPAIAEMQMLIHEGKLLLDIHLTVAITQLSIRLFLSRPNGTCNVKAIHLLISSLLGVAA